jgi:hypothetical protein
VTGPHDEAPGGPRDVEVPPQVSSEPPTGMPSDAPGEVLTEPDAGPDAGTDADGAVVPGEWGDDEREPSRRHGWWWAGLIPAVVAVVAVGVLVALGVSMLRGIASSDPEGYYRDHRSQFAAIAAQVQAGQLVAEDTDTVALPPQLRKLSATGDVVTLESDATPIVFIPRGDSGTGYIYVASPGEESHEVDLGGRVMVIGEGKNLGNGWWSV